jgi:murein DD-endopeptidase MepM/ murein hydrolase activator NlpD
MGSMSADYLLRGLFGLFFAWAPVALAASPVEVQPERARPGDALLVSVGGVVSAPRGTLGGRKLDFYPIAGGFQALVGLRVDEAPGQIPVVVILPAAEENGATETLRTEVAVEEPDFRATTLSVEPRFVSPPPAVREQIRRDRAAFRRAFGRGFAPPLFSGRFIWPRQASLTGRFGDRRIFNGTQRSQHYGDDIQGAEGEPIAATNDGEVTLVRDCYYSGRSVVIHHGAGLYSVYFHLSRFGVRVGQKVKRGDALGLIGRTGRVTGPHLHWGMKVGGLYVDPESVLRLPFGGEQPATARPAPLPPATPAVEPDSPDGEEVAP